MKSKEKSASTDIHKKKSLSGDGESMNTWFIKRMTTLSLTLFKALAMWSNSTHRAHN